MREKKDISIGYLCNSTASNSLQTRSIDCSLLNLYTYHDRSEGEIELRARIRSIDKEEKKHQKRRNTRGGQT